MQKAEPFATRLLRWFDKHGRHDLPWQHPHTPYRVWLAEIMLQQTQVVTVIPYFLRFVEKFTSLQELATAPLDDVLAQWSGLGYYSRARNLHRTAQLCVQRHSGELPKDFDALQDLPGIGRTTAGAILAQAHGMPFAILDGNVKRVLARYHGVHGWTGSSTTQNQLWKLAQGHTPARRIADYTQAVMDLGATLCTRAKPRCTLCPFAGDCIANIENLTALLPERKSSRALPTRTTMMLLLRDSNGRLLLHRRPPTGVWAQLWSLPEAADLEEAKRRVSNEHTLAAESVEFRHLPAFVHTFSHYRLDVTPLTIEVGTTRRIGDDPDRRWLLPAQASELGLPAPVRKLIENLTKES